MTLAPRPRPGRLFAVILLLPLMGLTPDPEGRSLQILSSGPWSEGGVGGRLLILAPPPMAVNALPGQTDEQVLALVRRLEAGEGEFIDVTGVRLEGHVHWIKGMRLVTDGVESLFGVHPQTPANNPSPRILDFYRSAGWEGCQRRAEITPPQQSGQITVDGVLCDYRLWRYRDAEFGTVTYLKGEPRRRS